MHHSNETICRRLGAYMLPREVTPCRKEAIDQMTHFREGYGTVRRSIAQGSATGFQTGQAADGDLHHRVIHEEETGGKLHLTDNG